MSNKSTKVSVDVCQFSSHWIIGSWLTQKRIAEGAESSTSKKVQSQLSLCKAVPDEMVNLGVSKDVDVAILIPPALAPVAATDADDKEDVETMDADLLCELGLYVRIHKLEEKEELWESTTRQNIWIKHLKFPFNNSCYFGYFGNTPSLIQPPL